VIPSRSIAAYTYRQREGRAKKGHEKSFRVDGNYLYLYCGTGFTDKYIYICQNSSHGKL